MIWRRDGYDTCTKTRLSESLPEASMNTQDVMSMREVIMSYRKGLYLL
jgi:hypothetical protein